MLERIVETIRHRKGDEARARAYLRRHASGGYGSHESSTESKRTAGFTIGTACSRPENPTPIEAPLAECGHLLVQGATGSGKTRLVLHMRRERVRRGWGCGVIDCKGELFETDIKWLAVMAAMLPAEEREQFIG